jgi:hypothetical protein
VLRYSVIRPWLIRDALTFIDSLGIGSDAIGCTSYSTKVLYIDPDYEFARTDIDAIIDDIETRGYYYNSRVSRGNHLSSLLIIMVLQWHDHFGLLC